MRERLLPGGQCLCEGPGATVWKRLGESFSSGFLIHDSVANRAHGELYLLWAQGSLLFPLSPSLASF
jgi:hypothetical protein